MISTVRLGTLGVAVVVLVACSSSPGGVIDGEATTSAGEVTAPPALDAPRSEGSVTAATTAPVGSSTEPPSTTGASATPSIATVPATGVPGLDSDDLFCRGWSEFAATFQALAFVSAAGADPVGAVRAEVVAAGAVLGAVATIDSSFPDVIAGERRAFVDGLLGPFTRRAGRARDGLLAAGLSARDVDELGVAWLDALASAGLDDPVVRVPGEFRSAVDTAAASFAATVPAIGDDPSLVTDVATPETLDYIAATCPDQGTLGGYDVID